MIVAAGVVTFEPAVDRLAENLNAIAAQVDRVAVFDNGSSNVDAVEAVVQGIESATLLKSAENLGIAAALNRLSEWALTNGFEWLVTLDQDSVAPKGMVQELSAVAAEHEAAIVTPFIVDRNKLSVQEYEEMSLPPADRYTQAARRGAITSGALTNLRVLFDVGGFDERFFIDYVDYDLNQRVLLAGHKIMRANRTWLLHEVGKAEATWLKVPRKDMSGTWHLEPFHSFGHSAQRCYYKARNRVLFTRKYGRRIGLTHEGIWQLPQQVLLTLLFERNRWSKLKGFARGFLDGLRTPVAEGETRVV